MSAFSRTICYLLLIYIQIIFSYYKIVAQIPQGNKMQTTFQESCYGINWASWNSFTGYSATGIIKNGTNTVSVTMTSDFTFDSTPTIYNYTAKLSSYPDLIPNSTVPRTTWSKGTGGTTNMCFSEK